MQHWSSHARMRPSSVLSVWGREAPEPLLAQECVVHPDDLSTLLIHCHSVEVVHLDVGLWPDGVCYGAGVLQELSSPKPDDILYALHRPRVHVTAELLHTVIAVAVLSHLVR